MTKECCGEILDRENPCTGCPYVKLHPDSRLIKTGEFEANLEQMDPPVADAEIYEKAILVMEDDQLTAAIFAAGGNRRHVNYFSRMQCGGKPIDPWAYERDRKTRDIVIALTETAETLRG